MSDQTRRRILAGVGGGTAAALLGGTPVLAGSERRQGGGGLAALQVAHMSPDAPNVDVYLGGQAVLTDVPFQTVSNFLPLAPGSYQLQVTPAGESPDQAVVDTMIDLAGRAYTAIATGEVADQNRPFYPLVHPVQMAPLGQDMARIRLFHLAPDAPRVDVVPQGGDPLFTGLGYSQYRTAEVPAGDYTLDVQPAGGGDPVTSFDVSLNAGWIYSGYVIGYVEPGNAPADVNLNLVTTVDGGTPTGMSGGGGGGS